MPPKPDNELTGDERKLLIISAKLFAALCEYALHPPVTDEQHAYWLEKIRQEMHVVQNIYGKYSPTGKHPRLHPAGQLFGQEWTQSQRNKRPFNWSGLTIDAVLDGCAKTCAIPLNAQWHPHLTAADISEYLREIAQKNWWWTHPPPTPAAPSDDVTMEDPPLQDVPLPPLPPARSRSRRLAAKGKAPAEALAAPSAPSGLAQQSGSTSKGKKRRVATPESESNGDDLFSAEVEDAAADGDDDTPRKAGQPSVVPRVAVEHPSPPSPSSPPRKIRKVIHIGMLDVRCGPCIAQKVPQCTSQSKDPSTVACEFCAGKKRKCFPVADWAKPIPDYALYPIQERLDLMEWHFSKVVGLLIVMARGQQIDPDTIAEVTAPPPLPRSISPSGQSGLSPSVGVSSLALSDAHSTASTRSSTKSDKPGGRTSQSTSEKSIGPRGRSTHRRSGDKA
ncbi:hypothetical protein V8E53_014247 [Lactarius tabidus]